MTTKINNSANPQGDPKVAHSYKNNSSERNSLRYFLTRTSILLSLLTGLIIILFFNHQFTQFTQSENEENTQETFRQSTNQVQRGLEEVASVSRSLENSDFLNYILDRLQNPQYVGTDHYLASQQLINYLFVLAQESQFIEDILLVTNSTQFSASMLSAGFGLNGIEKNPAITSNQLFYDNEFFRKTSNHQGLNKDLSDNDFSYFDDKLYFVANIENAETDEHAATAFVILNTDTILTSFLTPEYYQIRINNQELFKGNSFSPTSQDIVLSREILPFNLEIKIQSANYRNPSLQTSLIFIMIMLVIVVVVSWPISDYMAKNALKSIDGLLDWMANQEPGKKVEHHNKSRFKLHNRIFLYLIVTTVLPFTIIMVLYMTQFYGNYIQDVQALQETRSQSKAELVVDEIKKLQNVLASLSLNTLPVQEDFIDTPSNIRRYLSNYQSTLNVRSISLLNNQQEELYRTNYYNYNQTAQDVQRYSHIKTAIYSTSGNYDFIFQTDKREMYGTIKLPILNVSPTLSNVDTVQIEFDQNYFAALPILEEAMSERLIVNNQPIFEFQANNITSNQPLPTTDLYQVNLPLNIPGWTYQVTFNQTSLTNEISLILSQYLSIFFIILLILLAIAYFIANSFLKPFSRIINQQDGLINFDRQPNFLEGIDEVTLIQNNFTEILDKLNQLVDEKITMQENLIKENYEKREIQLFALQDQINPHFLYNALDNLLFLVEDEQTDAAVEMVHSLVNYFQFINNRKDLVVPLWKEIDFTRHYLNIMNARFDNFQVHWDVDTGIANRPLLKLILQPLVENVVHHGVRNTERMIHLDISVHNQNDQLEIIVADDADGMSAEKLQQIQSYLTNPTYNRSGLLNVYDRLTLYYNENFTFEISSQPLQGTSVRIVIPSFVKSI
ncbi:sensor histidine kinase [Fundicoccus sp. Sow4_H7]|uniref:sensor histidine kinase n=1 Tax=Fundicoccus sp. Sow4_H7 TaxID=3438784 RepID=UPI003F8DB9F7